MTTEWSDGRENKVACLDSQFWWGEPEKQEKWFKEENENQRSPGQEIKMNLGGRRSEVGGQSPSARNSAEDPKSHEVTDSPMQNEESIKVLRSQERH